MNRTELIGYAIRSCGMSTEEVEKVEDNGAALLQEIFKKKNIELDVDVRELVDGAFGGNLCKKDFIELKSAVLISVDGTVKNVCPCPPNKVFSLQEQYNLTNTNIVEYIWLPNKKIMIVGEEGALKKDKKVNWLATQIYADAALKIGRSPQFIFGNVLLIDEDQTE